MSELFMLGALDIVKDIGTLVIYQTGRHIVRRFREKSKQNESKLDVFAKVDPTVFDLEQFQSFVDEGRLQADKYFATTIEKTVKNLNLAISSPYSKQLSFISTKLEELQKTYREITAQKIKNDFEKQDSAILRAATILISDSLISFELLNSSKHLESIEKRLTLNQNEFEISTELKYLVALVETLTSLVKFRGSQQTAIMLSIFDTTEILSEDARILFEQAQEKARDEVLSKLGDKTLQRNLKKGKIRRPFWFFGQRKYRQQVEENIELLSTSHLKKHIVKLSIDKFYEDFLKKFKDIEVSKPYFIKALKRMESEKKLRLKEAENLVFLD